MTPTLLWRMLMLDTGEPFGLPKGTVRGVIALSFSTAALFLWVTGQPLPDALLGVTTLIIGNYFGTRGSGDAAPPAPEVVAAPYVPGDEEPQF